MRIGIVTGEYPPMQGGVGAYTQIIARHLHEKGHPVYLFSTAHAQSDTLPLTNTITHWNIASLRAIKQWASENQLDILNLQFQTAAFAMSPTIHFLPDALRPLPVVTTFHDLRFPYLFPKAGPLRNWIVMHLAQRSAGAIVTNHEDEQRIKHLRNYELIPIGSNILAAPAIDDSLRQQIGASSSDFLLAYFGLINQSKGLETLLHSIAQLRGESIPARLVIIGGVAGSSDPTNTAYIKTIEQLTTQLQLDTLIHYTGYLDDDALVGGFLKASDAVVLPFRDGASFRRGSLMAAIHYGCPIITTVPRVHVPEFVHGQNMLLIPPDDPASLAATLRELYSNPDIGEHLRRGATQLAGRFNWERITHDYITFFERIAGDIH